MAVVKAGSEEVISELAAGHLVLSQKSSGQQRKLHALKAKKFG